jgi:hypothetical protein
MQKILIPESEKLNLVGAQKVKFQDKEYFLLLASDRVKMFTLFITGNPTVGVLITDLKELDLWLKNIGQSFADVKERGDVFHHGEVIGQAEEIEFLEDVVVEFY